MITRYHFYKQKAKPPPVGNLLEVKSAGEILYIKDVRIPHLINSSFSDASESYSFNNMNKVSYTFAKQAHEIQLEILLK